MNLSALKLGFASYLEEINEISNKNYNTSNTDVSIFMYANEFKNYISDELDVDPKVLSMSINDILNMEIVNGKLVDPNAEEEIEAPSSDKAEKADETAKTEDADTEEQTDDSVKSYGENPTVNMGEESVSELLNNLFEQDNIKSVIDTDQDGELNEEEIQTFINAIKGYDGDGENISLEDVLGAMQAINNETFSLDPEAAEQIEEEVKASKEAEAAKAANASTGTSSGSGVSGSGSGASGVSGNVASQEPQEKTLENMSKEELNSELKTAESDLSSKQSALSDILSGSDPQIAALQEAVDENYEAYHDELEKVDEDMAKQLDELKTNIDDKEKEIDEKEQEISDQECTVSDCETAYNNAVTTRETLETSLSALESTDTSNMDDSKKAELSSKISELKSKIEDAKTAEDEAKTAWDEAEEKLTELQDEKEELQSGEGGLDELNEQMTELEEEIAEKYPEIKQYMDAYKDAKQEYTETKQEAITTAKADIQEAQEYVNEVKTAINNYDNKETVKEYCFGTFGEDIIEFAQQFIGCNEGDGSADKFLGGASSSQIPWCAAFVEYIMENGGSYDDVPDWYKNIDNKWYCPNVYSAAQSAGAIIDGSEAQPGDIVLFDWDGDGTRDHIGIVVSVENGVVTTIEGNTSNQVAQRTYNLGDGRLTYCKVVS